MAKPGSPAPAGMDPRRSSTLGRADGLPRTRGDGPPPGKPKFAIFAAPPHPRGWTRPVSWPFAGILGSPAPAGMDPELIRPGCLAPRLPRTRGDGPGTGQNFDAVNEAPPHPRGWTFSGSELAPFAHGSPAPAGMDPVASASSTRRSRLPRTRGDGPTPPEDSAGNKRAPPHPRGWTPRLRRRAIEDHGSPAPAGMDLLRDLVADPACGLPRTRGDGPSCIGAPVARWLAPPHPRGWTRTTDRFWPTPSGSPAPAGMDPCIARQLALR